MNDLMRLTAFENRDRRYLVRSVGSNDESTHFNTWTTLGDAERQRAERRELNPGVDFEIVDLATGEPVGPAHAFRNDEDGVEGRVWDAGLRGWSVTLFHIDSGETIPDGKLFPRESEADAIAYAKLIAGVL